MRRRPPRSTRTDTLFPYSTLFRSGKPARLALERHACVGDGRKFRLQAAFPFNAGDRTFLLERDEGVPAADFDVVKRSEEHTSELQSLMRISYAVFCLKKKQKH